MPKYPKIRVQVTGQDGNVFFIIARVITALKRAKVPRAEIDAFVAEAQSGDDDHALQTVMRTVTVR